MKDCGVHFNLMKFGSSYHLKYLIKTPKLLHSFYKDAVWVVPNANNEVFLTFDDGPVESVTDEVLSILKSKGVKATFFVVGDNVAKNPELFARVKAEGHEVGNHTYNHLKGWKTDRQTYLENIQKCADLVGSHLFRPPYGKIKKSQLREVAKAYKVIMWDVLSGDFDTSNSAQNVINNVLKNTKSGSIIVMHDNEKSADLMLAALPQIIDGLMEKGFSFGEL